ncbi:MAG TPA: nucleotidyltransferase family protein [Gemmataceae bacterium]|nr:nucleotidyltransferase family protein [Gemmataceae bacterium]
MKFAVIPAAGKSSRMGRPKLALPLGERTILEHVLAALRQAEIEHILVLIGPHVAELAPLAESAGAYVCSVETQPTGMRGTVEHGLHWLEERFQPRPEDTWLLVPADHPALDASVAAKLESAYAAHPQFSIVIPTYLGRRGHPTLFAWKHVAAIRAWPAELGLNTYVRQHVAETLEVPVDSAGVLWDMDTPEDYEWLRQNWLLPTASRARNDPVPG